MENAPALVPSIRAAHVLVAEAGSAEASGAGPGSTFRFTLSVRNDETTTETGIA